MTQSKVLILQHVPWEKPGRILDSLDDLGMSYEIANVAKEKKPDLPDFKEISGVVIMGGPMGALDFDKYPGLKAEGKLARAARLRHRTVSIPDASRFPDAPQKAPKESLPKLLGS